VATEKESVGSGVALKFDGDFLGEGGNVLVVGKDGNPFAVEVGFDTFEAFEHFVTGNGEAALRVVTLGKESAPNGVGVEDAPGVAGGDDGEMKESFGGGFTFSFQDGGALIDFEEVFGGESGLVESRTGDQQTQRGITENCAVVAAGAESPAAGVKFATDGGELCGERGAAGRLGRAGHERSMAEDGRRQMGKRNSKFEKRNSKFGSAPRGALIFSDGFDQV
jgi:hypothetical protein